jgi:hypothetical protein
LQALLQGPALTETSMVTQEFEDGEYSIPEYPKE